MRNSTTSLIALVLVAGLTACATGEKTTAVPGTKAQGAAPSMRASNPPAYAPAPEPQPVAAPAPAATAGQPSARNIYYEPSGGPGGPGGPGAQVPPAQQQAGVRFWVELFPRMGGQPQTVSADYIFHSGDRTRYRVATNLNCCIYVAHEGSTGERYLLYPSSQAGLDNQATAYQDKVMPSTNGFFTFDPNPGDERIVVVISPTRIPELDGVVRGASSRGLLTPDENQTFSRFLQKETGQSTGGATRNIVYEPVNSGPQTGSYYSQQQPGFNKPIVINVTLKHQP